jgi:hypothetical protein
MNSLSMSSILPEIQFFYIIFSFWNLYLPSIVRWDSMGLAGWKFLYFPGTLFSPNIPILLLNQSSECIFWNFSSANSAKFRKTRSETHSQGKQKIRKTRSEHFNQGQNWNFSNGPKVSYGTWQTNTKYINSGRRALPVCRCTTEIHSTSLLASTVVLSSLSRLSQVSLSAAKPLSSSM